jgi:3-deoxy-D-manno-octulosonate 8-phosphate phosphatase (KDO 8-P phosphatase)
MASNKIKKPKVLVLDVDGVLTDGQFHYTKDGKVEKIFGPDDSDAIQLIKPYMEVIAVSGDKRGYPITQKRVEEDMGIPLHQVSTFERVNWLSERYDLDEVIYIGDGIFDAMVFDKVGYSIAPANAFFKIKEYADYVTEVGGAKGAVAQAVWHIAEKFFTPFDALNLKIGGGVWSSKE